MIILRTSDQIPLRAGDLRIWVSPLSWADKTELYKMASVDGQIDESSLLVRTLLKTIKRIDGFDGFEFIDGSSASLEWRDGRLTMESLELLIRVLGTVKASSLSAAILQDAIMAGVDGFEIDLVEAKKKKDS